MNELLSCVDNLSSSSAHGARIYLHRLGGSLSSKRTWRKPSFIPEQNTSVFSPWIQFLIISNPRNAFNWHFRRLNEECSSPCSARNMVNHSCLRHILSNCAFSGRPPSQHTRVLQARLSNFLSYPLHSSAIETRLQDMERDSRASIGPTGSFGDDDAFRNTAFVFQGGAYRPPKGLELETAFN